MDTRISSEIMLKILECIYEESFCDMQVSQKDIAEQFNISKPTINKLFQKLEKDKWIETSGIKRGWRFKWVKNIKPTEALAIKLGAITIRENKVFEFTDDELIKELKKRGYLIFKEY